MKSDLFRRAKNAAAITFCLFFLAGVFFSQFASDGQKPKGLEPGAPFGSYSLSNFEHINLFNGNLNFNMPLFSVGGRGRVAWPLNVNIDSAKWHVDLIPSEVGRLRFPGAFPVQTTLQTQHESQVCVSYQIDPQPTPTPGHTSNPTQPDCEVDSTWITTDFEFTGETVHFNAPDGPKIFQVTADPPALNLTVTATTTNYGLDTNTAMLLTRITFTDPDGTEHQLRDVLTSGQPHRTDIYVDPHSSDPQFTPHYDRGKVFKSFDSQNITFVSDSNIYDETASALDTLSPVYPSGYLYFADGSVYRIQDGSITSKHDVNGNTVQYLTDPLGRTVTVVYHGAGSNSQDPNETLTEYQYHTDASTTRSIRVYTTALSNVLRSDYPSVRDTDGMFPELQDIVVAAGGIYNPTNMVSRIILPDGREYRLKYNPYGELARVELPSGAAIEYDFFQAIEGHTEDHSSVFRPLLERRVYAAGGSSAANNTPDEQQKYARDGLTATQTSKVTVTTFARNPDSGLLEEKAKEVHYFNGGAEHVYRSLYSAWALGREYRSEVYAPGGSTPLRVSETEWENPTANDWTLPADPSIRPENNPRIKSVTSHITEGADTLTSKVVYGYDDTNSFNNRTDEWAYDYGVGNSPGRLLKHTQTGYLKVNPENNIDYTSDSVHMYSLPAWTKVFDVKPDGSEQLLSQTETKYDESSYPVLTYNGTPTGWTEPQTTARGNPTTVRTLVVDENRWIETHAQFDQFGNIRKAWDTTGDPNRFVETEYSPDYQYAFPTKVTTPPPNPSGVHGTDESSFVTTAYNFYTGKPISVTDEFGQTTITEYNDLLDRPTHFLPPPGGAQTTVEYGDTVGNLYVKTRKQLDATNWDESTTFFDGLGRAVKTQSKDSQGDVFVETHYDGLGRVDRVTNPYRAGDTVYWSKTRFDEIGRAVETYAPTELANLSSAQSLGITSFGISTVNDSSGNFVGTYVTATDASGRKSRSITNALGQLIRVDEATAIGGTETNDLGTLASPNQATYYKYDAYGKMVQVTQGVQNRFFKYDSLGRLIRVNQPEQDVNSSFDLADSFNAGGHWTAAFVYDDLGNVLRATDANGVNVINEYDKANRVTRRCYTKPNVNTTATTCAQIASGDVSTDTPTVQFWYDGKGLPTQQSPNYAKGKLTKVDNGISTSLYMTFDNFGRLTRSQQITDGVTYGDDAHPMTYTYNLSGALTQETYPSGRVVKNDFESDGDLQDVVSKKAGATVFTPYVSDFSYTASGGISQMKLGNGRWESAIFNTRLQVTDLGLGGSATDTSLWKTHYDYGELSQDGATVDTTKNTGNIARQTLTVPGTSFTQNYRYDSLDRLTEAKETTGTNQNWIQNWNYDRYGNRLLFTKNVAGDTLAPNPSVNPNTNRFNDGQGFTYDKNGNVVHDVDSITSLDRTFIFNADNKQIAVNDANGNPIGQYFYDGEGKRVKKVTGTETTVFVYSSGKLVAEYSTQLSSSPSINYTATDHLGSPRIITDAFGQVKSRRDFMPFGEELNAGVGSRTGETGLKYSLAGDPVRQKFTGYQKDNETNLDFAEARMYANEFGRFTAVDPLIASGKSANPQSFNRYVYVGNEPLKKIDPSGMIPGDYYSYAGDYLGSDGKDDHEVYFASLAKRVGGKTYVYTSSIASTTLEEVQRAKSFFTPSAPGSESAAVRTLANVTVNSFRAGETGIPKGVGNFFIDLLNMATASFNPSARFGGPNTWAIPEFTGSSPLERDYIGSGKYGMVGGSFFVAAPFAAESSLSVAPEEVGATKFWSSSSFEGTRVFQRNDIFNPGLVSKWTEGGTEVFGSNVERMASGRAPIGIDGESVNLHHLIQTNNSSLAEMTGTFHQVNSRIIHINPTSFGSGINRPIFDAFRSRYWMNRALDFK